MRFNVDYLAVTLHAGTLLDVQDLIERSLFSGTIWDQSLSWESHPVESKMWSQRTTYASGDLTLMQGRAGFLCLQMKSRACEVLQENLPAFVSEVHFNGGRHKCTRLDGCWSPVPWDPDFFLSALRSDQLVSSLRKHGASWVDSDSGRTAAFPSYDKRHDAPRFLRCYDMRGYTRLELELHDPDAADCFARLAVSDQDEWSSLFVGYLLRTVDFRVGQQKNAAERVRSGWWSDLVGNAEKIRSLAPPTVVEPERTLLERAKGFVRRNARQMDAIIQAGGVDWLLAELAKSTATGRKADDQTVKALKKQMFPPPRPPVDPASLPSSEFFPF